MSTTEVGVTVRPASPDDAQEVARIWYDSWRDGHLGLVPDELVAIRTPESFGERASQRVTDTVVALVGDSVTGFVMVDNDEVEQVFVSRSHRGTGVASILLAEAERMVAVQGHGRAWLAVATGNERARRFYARNGWADEGAFDYRAAGPAGPILVPCHRYAKQVVAD
jgi:GNAT superfamily N-acetyltransferase